MERYEIGMGDFLKNAGISGLVYLLKIAGAEENVVYGITEDGQKLWLDADFAVQADWTDLYFRACTEYFGPSTAYQGVLDRIESCLEKLETDRWQPEKREKEDLKYINEKLLSNSYQAGYENIKERIEHTEIYIQLKENKLNDRMSKDELQKRLQTLQEFLLQPICRETFIMKSVVYTYINRFWDGKCFLLRANAKKDMRELFEAEFSEPMRNYWKEGKKKGKDLCIDCAAPMGTKEKVSIAFMKEVADDLARKKSAFWNCKVDAFLCPVCAYIYALSPLGFRLFANKFVFINNNNSMKQLLDANSKWQKSSVEALREKDEAYQNWFARMMDVVLQEDTKRLKNIQVVARGVLADDTYFLRIISEETLQIVREDSVKRALSQLSAHPYAKIKNEFQNIHEKVVVNLLMRWKQYPLLNEIMRAALENEGLNFYIRCVYEIQLWTNIIQQKNKEGEQRVMDCGIMTMYGENLRRVILAAKGTESVECLRGTIYQMMNALTVKNKNKYMEIVMRLYNAYGARSGKNGMDLLLPNGLVQMLQDSDKFTEYGYAFLMGLYGCYGYVPKKGEQ